MNGTYIPPHPGRYLREDLEEFGIEPRIFAKRIGVDVEELLAVLEEKAPITRDLAERIAGNLEGPVVRHAEGIRSVAGGTRYS